MIASRIGVVCCRVGAVVLIVNAIQSLGYVLPNVLKTESGFAPNTALIATMIAIPLIAAAVLWFFAGQISGLGDEGFDNSCPESIAKIDLVEIGTLLIGLYVLIFGIFSAVSIEVTQFIRLSMNLGSDDPFLQELNVRDIGERASYMLQITLGIFLVVGKERIARFLTRVRYLGRGAS